MAPLHTTGVVAIPQRAWGSLLGVQMACLGVGIYSEYPKPGCSPSIFPRETPFCFFEPRTDPAPPCRVLGWEMHEAEREFCCLINRLAFTKQL